MNILQYNILLILHKLIVRSDERSDKTNTSFRWLPSTYMEVSITSSVAFIPEAICALL